jgi:hypothetical protein
LKVAKTAVKVGVAVVALAGLGVLFMRSMSSTRSEPYTVPAEHLRHWTLAVEADAGPRGPMLVLRTSEDLVNGLFNQVFKRAMESMNPPSAASIPLLLPEEYQRAFAGRVSPEALLAAARAAGLDRISPRPRCLAYRRYSEPRLNQQLYFVIFDLPEYARFRQEAAALLGGGPARAAFDPDAQSPILFVAAAESTFQRWLPLRANPQVDCVAPVEVGGAVAQSPK